MNPWYATLAVIAGSLVSGAGLARGLGLFSPRHGLLERAALGFGIGHLQATTVLFLANLLGVPFGSGLAWFALTPGLIGWLRRAPLRMPGAPEPTPPAETPPAEAPASGPRRPWLTALLALFLALGIGRTAAITLAEPITNPDAFLVWQFKGRAFHADRDLCPVLTSTLDYDNRDYPLHVSLASTHVYGLAGAADDFAAKLPGLAYYLAILALAGAALGRRVGRHGGLFLTALLAALPPLAGHAGAGIADVPLAFFFLGTTLALDAYRREGDPRRLALAAVLLYGCLWTKNEGVAITAMAVVVAAALVTRRRRWRDLAFLAPILLIVPWLAFRAALGLQSDHLADPLAHGATDALARLPEILVRASGNAFRPDWLGLWAALLLLIGLRPRAALRAWPILAMVGGTIAGYVAVLAVTGGDHVWLIHTAFGRLLLHTAPAATVVVADLWGDAVRQPGRRATTPRR